MENTLIRDTVFYSQIIPVVFKVEDTLFRVLRDPLLHPGSFFETIFGLHRPQPDSGEGDLGVDEELKASPPTEGTSDDRPIVLEGISVNAFRNLLGVVYPFRGKECRTYEEWIDVLALSTMWDLTEIRRHAIEQLSPMVQDRSVFFQIAVGEQYRVKRWFLAGLNAVAASLDPIPVVEMKSQGIPLETICLLAAVQSQWLTRVFKSIMKEKEEVTIMCLRCGKKHCGANITSLDTDQATKPFRQPPAKEIEDLVKDVFKHVLHTFPDE